MVTQRLTKDFWLHTLQYSGLEEPDVLDVVFFEFGTDYQSLLEERYTRPLIACVRFQRGLMWSKMNVTRLQNLLQRLQEILQSGVVPDTSSSCGVLIGLLKQERVESGLWSSTYVYL